MKKVVLALAVVFGVAMVSCSDKKAEAQDTDTVAVEDTSVVVDEVANDSDTAVIAVAEVATEAAPATEEAK